MQYPVVDLHCGLMFANDALQKQMSISPFSNVGNSGNSGSDSMGASEKSPSGRLIEGRPLEKFVLYCMPQLRMQQRYVAMLLKCLQ